MKKFNQISILTLLMLFAFCNNSYAQQFYTIEEAQKAVFHEADRFKPHPIVLTNDQTSKIKKSSSTGTPIPDKRIWQVIKAEQLIGWFVVDEVYGKHEFITYAVGINLDGTVRMIDIMDYRETYGYQVREASWRQQFTGKNVSASLKLDNGIDNISGATLSCKHLADGVKRVLTLYDTALKGIN